MAARRFHLSQNSRNHLLQFRRESLSDLIEIVAGEIVKPHDRFRVLAFDRARDKRRIVFGPHVGLDATKRLLADW